MIPASQLLQCYFPGTRIAEVIRPANVNRIALLLTPAPASTPPASISPFLRKFRRSASGNFCPSAATFCNKPVVVVFADVTWNPQDEFFARVSCILENSNIKEKR
jgi:hypothetical protein